MQPSGNFLAYVVRRDPAGSVRGSVEPITCDQLPAGDVLIRVDWSSLNYKDALAAAGHPGVVRQFPHVPGIDAAGTVTASSSSEFAVGQSVLVTGYELGAGQWGGWGRYVRVPTEWVVPLPDGLSLRQAMVIGTAGFTAAQCVLRLQHSDVRPESGPIVVTGATGGVGCLAVKLLAHLGYQVTASTGKPEESDWLHELGAETVIPRDELLTPSDKPLAPGRWAGAVDTVGGETLASIIRAGRLQACITACGLVAGADLPLTVYPFILRGVELAGITSQNCERSMRWKIWQTLAGPWRLTGLERVTHEVPLSEVSEPLAKIRAGRLRGRVLIRIGEVQDLATESGP